MSQEQAKDWYTPKEIYEMLVETNKKLESFGAELGKTQTLIRDYNGLREDVRLYREEVKALCSKDEGKQESKIDVFNVVMVIIAFAAAVAAYLK